MSNIAGPLPSEHGEKSAWLVTVNQSDLYLERQPALPSIPRPEKTYRRNLGLIGLSIVMELFVAGLCFQVWAKADFRTLIRRLMLILLINLLSMPVVWITFPSLAVFHYHDSRQISIFLLLVVGMYSILLVKLFRASRENRSLPIFLMIVSLPLTFFCLYVGLISVQMDHMLVDVQGLTATTAIVLAEGFAVAYEALMLFGLSNRSLPAKIAWLVSLLANPASFCIVDAMSGLFR